MRVKKITEKQFTLDCINREFEIIGSEIHFNTFEALSAWALNNKGWFNRFEFSSKEQYLLWKEYFLTHFYDWQPKRISKRQAEDNFGWFSLNYGFTANFKL